MTEIFLFAVMIGGGILAMVLLFWWAMARGFPIMDGMLDGLTYAEAREKADIERVAQRKKALEELESFRKGDFR